MLLCQINGINRMSMGECLGITNKRQCSAQTASQLKILKIVSTAAMSDKWH